MRRYLAHCPDEEPWIFRMLDLISQGAQGHGPVHLLLISAAELGFACDARDGVRLCSGLPPSPRNDDWAYSALLFFLFWMPGVSVFLPGLLRGRVFWVVSLPIFRALYNYLTRPTCGNEMNFVKNHFVLGCLERIPSWQGQEGR